MAKKNKKIKTPNINTNKIIGDDFLKQTNPNYKKVYTKSTEELNNWKNLNPVWSFSRCERTGKWSIDENISNSNSLTLFLNKLSNFEKMTWNEILTATHDKSNKSSNHDIKVSKLCKEAQKKLELMKLDDEEVIFSLRFSNKERLFGFRENNVLRIIWFSDKHDICPSSK